MPLELGTSSESVQRRQAGIRRDIATSWSLCPEHPSTESWVEQDVHPPPALSLVGDGWQVPSEPPRLSRGSRQPLALYFPPPKRRGRRACPYPPLCPWCYSLCWLPWAVLWAQPPFQGYLPPRSISRILRFSHRFEDDAWVKASPGGYHHLSTPWSRLREASSTGAPSQGCSSFCRATLSPACAVRGVSLPPLWPFAQGTITGTAPQPRGTRTVFASFGKQWRAWLNIWMGYPSRDIILQHLLRCGILAVFLQGL